MNWINTVLQLNNPFDYDEYLNTNPVDIIPLHQWGQQVGMLKVAMIKFPDKSPEDAFKGLIELMNQEYNKTPAPVVNAAPCNTCGGGRVL